MAEMLTRISNITSYEHVPNDGAGHACTNLVHHWHGEYYTSRFFGTLSPACVAEEEDRFIERRHRRARDSHK